MAVGAVEWRTGFARQLLAQSAPGIIRGNASEIIALAGGNGGKGVESVDTADQALDAAAELNGNYGSVIAISGAVDHIVAHGRLLRVHNGDPLLTKVTGAGCALGALIAAFAAVVDDHLLAAAAATALLTIAADEAARTATRPGSFALTLLDQRSRLN